MARKIGNRKLKSGVYIMVDGQSEVAYFNAVKSVEGLTTKIAPELCSDGLEKQFNTLIDKLSSGYNRFIWLVDYDVIGRHQQQELFNTYKARFLKKGKELKIDAHVLLNNPCLEFWFLLHFLPTTMYFNDCKSAEDQLKIQASDYVAKNTDPRKSLVFYLKVLKPKLQQAIKNARQLDRSTTPVSARADIVDVMHDEFALLR